MLTALLGASQAHRGLPRTVFAAAFVVFGPQQPKPRLRDGRYPARGDFCGDEEHSTRVGARQRASSSCLPHLFERSAEPEGLGA